MPDLAPREPIVLSESYRSRRTVQTENSLATMRHHVDVGRSMIIGIDHNPEPVESETRRQLSLIVARFLSAWVLRARPSARTGLPGLSVSTLAINPQNPATVYADTAQGVFAITFVPPV